MTTIKVVAGFIIVIFADIGFVNVFGDPFAVPTANIRQAPTMSPAIPEAIGDYFGFLCYFIPIAIVLLAGLLAGRPLLLELLTGFINRNQPVNGVLPTNKKKVGGAPININTNALSRSALAF